MLGLKLYLLEIYTKKWNVDTKPDHLLHRLHENNIPFLFPLKVEPVLKCSTKLTVSFPKVTTLWLNIP